MRSLYETIFDKEASLENVVVKPRTEGELWQIIDEHIKRLKPRSGEEVNLNWIDISLVKNLSELFANTDYIPVIDKWKIDHVEDFSFMFARNNYIVRSPIPVLQEKLLGVCCYERMFLNCTALKEPPVLPAKKLEHQCYTAMFRNCTSLETAPELPAENLTYGCYGAMFEGCTTLKEPPVLPAKKLEKLCYARMFEKCSSLTEPPELPAKELVRYCYEEMFKNCSNLRAKAKIPKNVPVDHSDYAMDMYKGCPNIKNK